MPTLQFPITSRITNVNSMTTKFVRESKAEGTKALSLPHVGRGQKGIFLVTEMNQIKLDFFK